MDDESYDIILPPERRSLSTRPEPAPATERIEIQVALSDALTVTSEQFINAWNTWTWTSELALAHKVGELSTARAFLATDSAEIIISPLKHVHPDALQHAFTAYLNVLLENEPFTVTQISRNSAEQLVLIQPAAA